LQERYASKYRSDLSFRTSVNIVALQAGFVVTCIAAVLLAARLSGGALYVFGSMVVVAAVFGVFVARFVLRPARETLQNQKLFISNVAHELRTPLSIIKTSSEVSLIGEDLSPTTRQSFKEIIEELNRASEIINNLLSLNALTRPERMRFQNIDLSPLVDDIVARHESFARERGIKIVVRKEVGSIAWGNRAALEQVMVNLLKNALSYTPEDTKGVVTITLRPDGKGMILFAVADTGIGISQEDLFHVFEPFYRADTSRVRNIQHQGSGLGLTIVNEMVRAHHGKIHVESAKRQGTVVSVYLPQGGFGARPTSVHAEASLDFSKNNYTVRH